MPFTILDIALIVVAALSAILAMMRGFSREVLSVLGWICASAAGIYAFFNPALKAFAGQFITPEWLASAVAVGGVFILTLLVISFLTVRISDMILDSSIGFLDRSLGFGFGLVRGILIVLMAYMLFSKLIPPGSQPAWIQNARSYTLLNNWSENLHALLPTNAAEQIKELKDRSKSVMEPLKGTTEPTPQAAPQVATPPAAGYKVDDRKALEQQIQNLQGSKKQ